VVGLPLRGVRVFTCACGKVQAGSLRSSKLVSAKWRYLVPSTNRYPGHSDNTSLEQT